MDHQASQYLAATERAENFQKSNAESATASRFSNGQGMLNLQFNRESYLKDFIFSKLSEEQRKQIIEACNQDNHHLAPLLVTFNRLNVHLINHNHFEIESKKLVSNFPDSLSKYIIKSFQKCVSTDELEFMQNILLDIFAKCKQRGILFNRDWESVAHPCLSREGALTYEKINKMIMDSNQGVIQKVE